MPFVHVKYNYEHDIKASNKRSFKLIDKSHSKHRQNRRSLLIVEVAVKLTNAPVHMQLQCKIARSFVPGRTGLVRPFRRIPKGQAALSRKALNSEY